MSYEIRADYQQRWLLPPCLEDWVPADHPARLIRDLVDSLDLQTEGFVVREAVDGRPSYAADLLLKVWLYGYVNAIRGTRPLERACREHLSLVWLTGRHAPDHNTLWRFFRDNRPALRRLLKRVVQLAVKAGLVGLVLHAVDGTKIAARASQRALWDREKLEKALGELDTTIEQFMQEVEQAQVAEGSDYRLPSEWQDAARRREQLRALLSTLEVEERAQGHAGDPTARLVKSGNGVVPGYNAQLAVDQSSELIVAAEVVAEETDNYQLVGMLDAVKGNTGAVASETVADGGYYAPKALAQAAERGDPVLLPEPAAAATDRARLRSEYHAARFAYDAARNVCICPRGEVLRFERWHTGREHRAAAAIYRCTVFRHCPVRWQCSRDPRGRSIEIGAYHEAVQAQARKRQDAQKRALLKQRAPLVEGPIGIIKEILKFRRWTVAGLDNVRTQWALVCIAFNLRKLLVPWRTGRLVFTAVGAL